MNQHEPALASRRTAFRSLALIGTLALAFGSATLQAATFCVTNVTQLRAALSTAASNGENDTIRIRRGTYIAPEGVIGFNYTSSENFSLTVEGGWFGATAGTCSIRIDDAEATILDGDGARSVMRLIAGVNSGTSFTVRNLTIRNGWGVGGGTDFGGLRIGGQPLLGDITIDRVIFRNNHSESLGGGMRVSTWGVVRVLNSLFDGNSCEAWGCALDILARAPTSSAGQPRIRFLGNTVVNTGCFSSDCDLGQVLIGVADVPETQYLIGNSVLALNDGVDIAFRLSNGALASTGTLRNSLWTSRLGSPQSMIFNLEPGTAPDFVDPAAGDFRLRRDSLLVDAGFLFPDLPTVDINGDPRLSGPFVDIGAYERQPDPDPIFSDGFE